MAEPSIPDKRAVRRSFERAAATYDQNSVLQCEIGIRLMKHLDPIRIDPHRIVVRELEIVRAITLNLYSASPPVS